MKKIKYGTIIPLVGGMSIGNSKATGHKPEFILSYPAFAENDSNLLNYWKDTPYYVIDEETNKLSTEDSDKIKEYGNVDFMTAVAPCAGLSMLNASNRGSDAAANDWLYKSAEFVLENVQPKVFWGENAPGLITSIGEGVRAKLWDIAQKYNYSFSIVKTNTEKHGIPQRRVRTFYFFWKSEAAPIMNYYNREKPHLVEYLKSVPEDASLNFSVDDINDNIFFKWFKENVNRDEIKHDNYTVIKLIEADKDKLNSLKEYIINNGTERDLKKINHIINKYSQGKGVWDDSPHFYTHTMNAVISKNLRNAVHPTEDRYLTNRELMHLMGLPHDFNLKSSKYNVYTQNVPVTTARDWTYEVMKFINGELELSDAKYLVQDNLTQKEKIEVPAKNIEVKALF